MSYLRLPEKDVILMGKLFKDYFTKFPKKNTHTTYIPCKASKVSLSNKIIESYVNNNIEKHREVIIPVFLAS